MKRTIALIAIGILSLASAGAQAQTPPVQLNMDSGLYLGGGIGKARTGQGCLGTCETTDETWNLYAGYQFNRHLAIEGGYSDFGEATVSGTLVGVPITTRFETTAWELVGVGLLPITDSFTVYLKAGIFRYETDATTTGAAVGASSENGTEFTVGMGFQYAFTRNLAARFEWQRYNDIGTGSPGMWKDDITVWRLTGRFKF